MHYTKAVEVADVHLDGSRPTSTTGISTPPTSPTRATTMEVISFEAYGEDGKKIPQLSEHTAHLRFIGMVMVLALPFTLVASTSTVFVVPGYPECNLGQDLCDLEYFLSTLIHAFVASLPIGSYVALGNPEKFMTMKPHVFWGLRMVLPFFVGNVVLYTLTGSKEDWIVIYITIGRCLSAGLYLPYFEIARWFLGCEDFWHPLRVFRDPDGLTKRLLLYACAVLVIPVSGLLFTAYALLDSAYLATGELGETLQALRPLIFFALKKLIYLLFCWGVNTLEYPTQAGGYLRQYGFWWIHVQMAFVTALSALNCKDWPSLLVFASSDFAAFLVRLFGFSNLWKGNAMIDGFRSFLRYGKPRAVPGMDKRELRGWDLLLEGIGLQTVYMGVLMFYPYARFVLGENSIFLKFWFPYDVSLMGVILLSLSDVAQDILVKKYVKEETNCTYSKFLDQPIFSRANLVLLVNLLSMCWCASNFSSFAYAFDVKKLGVFKTPA